MSRARNTFFRKRKWLPPGNVEEPKYMCVCALAASATAVVGAAGTAVATAAEENDNQNNNPAAVTAAKEAVVTHTKTSL